MSKLLNLVLSHVIFSENSPVYHIAFALGASGSARSTIFDVQKDVVAKILNLPTSADRKFALMLYDDTADIENRFEHFRNDSMFLTILRSLSLPDSDASNPLALLSVLQKAPELFRSSPTTVNKVIVVFTNSLLPADLRPFASAAQDLKRQGVKLVMVTVGDRTDRRRVSSWVTDPANIIDADPRNPDRSKLTNQIATIIYRGNGFRSICP